MTAPLAEAHNGTVAEQTVARVGPIAVRTDAAAVLDFQRACGGEPVPGIVPAILPICWLALPVVRARLVEIAGGDMVPVHESQSFTIERRLEFDREYRLDAAITRTSQPERLTLRGAVSTPEGDLCVRFETVLRLVGLEGNGIGAPDVMAIDAKKVP